MQVKLLKASNNPALHVIFYLWMAVILMSDVGNCTEACKTGAVISFRFDGNYTSVGRQGSPMNPRIYCVRHDIQNWDVVVQNKKKLLPTKQVELPSMT
jgi:hypothetical protein